MSYTRTDAAGEIEVALIKVGLAPDIGSRIEPEDVAKVAVRVIEAHSEMLAALREIAALNGIYCGVAVELARAAIAKAGG